MSRIRFLAALLALSLVFSACNLPSRVAGDQPPASGDAVLTAAALTVEAQLTRNPPPATAAPTATAVVLPSAVPSATTAPAIPTNTPLPTAIPTKQIACDVAGFISDVTIPDGTEFSPGATFTKTWRLRNNGSCTWNPDYELVFDSKEQMGGPVAQQLTSNSIAPGGTLEVSVDLTAPAAAGTHRGNWKLRNQNGIVFGLGNGGPFFVEIKVIGPTNTPSPSTKEITLNASAAGSVWGDGTVNGNPNTGDSVANIGIQAFVQFDISGIPNGSTIDKVVVNFSNYDIIDATTGAPFTDLGYLRAYPGSYFPLDAGDYASGGATGAVIRWGSTGDLSSTFADEDVKASIQSALGGSTYELRLRFNDTETDDKDDIDLVRFGTVSLTVTYTTP